MFFREFLNSASVSSSRNLILFYDFPIWQIHRKPMECVCMLQALLDERQCYCFLLDRSCVIMQDYAERLSKVGA